MSNFKTISKSTCAKVGAMASYSDWMSQLPSKLFSVPLWNLAIPGSHDSMTYCLDSSSLVEQNEPEYLKILDHIFPEVVSHFIMKWGTTEELTLRQQLDAGIRYFDLRVACKPNGDGHTLYFAHGLYTTVTVEETFKDIAGWLAEHPKEIIILACSDFSGMNTVNQQAFIAQLTEPFLNIICPRTETPSLQLCWDKKYQVILSCDFTSLNFSPDASNNKELWPKVDYWWSTKDRTSATKVTDYLQNRLQTSGRDESKFFVAGLNLTEDAKYVLRHLLSSMKDMTMSNYPELLDWVKKQQCGPGKSCINIIAADFVGVNNFVPLVIEINQKM